jgi:hypothetical protein
MLVAAHPSAITHVTPGIALKKSDAYIRIAKDFTCFGCATNQT